jgi:hypothetical protein
MVSQYPPYATESPHGARILETDGINEYIGTRADTL